MNIRRFVILGVSIVCASWSCSGQEASPATPQDCRAAIEQVAKNYEAAFNRADVEALGAMFTQDIEYTDEGGATIVGREAIKALLRKSFSQNKGAKLATHIETVRALGSDVAVERGSTVTTATDGTRTTSAYTAVHVRKDGKWLIGQLVESPAPAPSPGEMLSELAWLIGTWQEKEGDTTTETKVDWARGGNFMTRTFKVTVADEVTLEGWQIIGWDAARNLIRSWLFDSEGAFTEGTWTPYGQGWLIRQAGTLSDGSRLSSDNTIRREGDDKFIWESTNRTLDGEPQPNLPKITASRLKQ